MEITKKAVTLQKKQQNQSNMRTIKADKESTRNFVSYEINGKYYEVWGEFHFNAKKNRWEHEHIGKRGGKYLIVW